MKSKFTILGCGSSLGSPWITNYRGNLKQSPKNLRTRCCAHIQKGNLSVCIDTSPDIKYQFLKNKIKNLRIKDLDNKKLLSDEVGMEASKLAKQKNIRKLIYSFQKNFAYNPPKKYNGSCLDGRDITYKIVPNANFKFFITANVNTRAMRRYKELKGLNKAITYKEVLKSIKNRDKSDYNRNISPLRKTKDSILINTTKLSKRACFLKIKKIIDRKTKT